MKNTDRTVSKKRTLVIFVCTIITGFILFALPNVFFGITKINGGLSGVNLLFIALFQCITVCSLIYFSLKLLNKDFQYIGWSGKNWKSDSILGLLFGLTWTALQFGFIIPNTGGAERADISQMVSMFDGTPLGTLSFIALGVIGGGITEEIYNRGYFINVLKDTFKNPTIGIWIAAVLSIVFFAIGHLPTDAISWFDILVPTIAYTVLFLYTKRLTASIIAHGIYNMTGILLTYYMYYQ
ncbi:CPBP family intramembrane metalloprotease [Aliifodinibius salicampi]|uniref:CPBP family intramembrane metalloprotease n=1 Tax=Fodinibius salicampi TaxID=1920655 RepID=A0ABT3PZU4_9BACT|nr:type II CAAX endopeptidase family protein [Fodinibius salicampi]MCW9713351.1 CPBP family intramembrane metalloprotease [Fodinibius salicampi]